MGENALDTVNAVIDEILSNCGKENCCEPFIKAAVCLSADLGFFIAKTVIGRRIEAKFWTDASPWRFS